jgi:sec-independent protein translocase protein TatA
MPHVGPTELIIILVIVIIIFGVGKLPEIGGALGKGIKEFKTASTDVDDIKDDLKDTAKLGGGKKPKAKAKDEDEQSDGDEDEQAS